MFIVFIEHVARIKNIQQRYIFLEQISYTRTRTIENLKVRFGIG